MRICILSQQHFSKKHVSQDMIDAFETAIITDESIETLRINISEIIYKINRKISSVGGVLRPLVLDAKTVYEVKLFNPDYVFIMAMGPGTLEFEIPFLRKIKSRKIVYCIDTWEASYPAWEKVIKEAGIDIVFCAYRSSLPFFSKIVDHTFFLPQSFNEKWFYPRCDENKTHLLMQMGRKNSSLDEFAHRYIAEKGLQDSDYVRELKKGEIIYPEFSDLGEAIAKTSFFILSPRDVDDKSFTGKISDVTARFYEGMASKTLLIGYKPKDTFDELFPYENAMIEVEGYEDFRNKIDYYLSNPEEYREIVDRNYEYLIKNHRWKNRVQQMVNALSQLLNESEGRT